MRPMENSAAAKEALHEISTMVHQSTDDNGVSMKISKSCYKTIIAAIERHIPKKPIDARRCFDLRIGRCPNCNDGTNSEYPYCGKCGQRINWRV